MSDETQSDRCAYPVRAVVLHAHADHHTDTDRIIAYLAGGDANARGGYPACGDVDARAMSDL